MSSNTSAPEPIAHLAETSFHLLRSDAPTAFARLGVRTTQLGVGGGVGPLTDPVVLVTVHPATLGMSEPLHKVRAVDNHIFYRKKD